MSTSVGMSRPTGGEGGPLQGAVDAGNPLAPTEIYSLTKKFVVDQWNLRTDNLASRQHTFTRPVKILRPPDRYSASIVHDRAITRLRWRGKECPRCIPCMS
ncbi:hypothetical protein DPMN_098130 [Dreissena polymorpha]|uniref:Uncharacterized protein n=1 Tax=Dreissena polymorpha TaxID=45954 RepID=A0A9D4LBH5_DREPO|nr:hypothetical protein DPMN_098130 [Dreissena polymorpha]